MYTHPEHFMRWLFCFRHLMIAKNPALACTTWTLGLLYSTRSICLVAAFFAVPHSQSYSQQECSLESAHRWASKQLRARWKLIFPPEKPVSVLLQTWEWNTRRIWVSRNGKQEMESATTMWECWKEEESLPKPKRVWKINLTILCARRAGQIGSSSWKDNCLITKHIFLYFFLYPQKLQHVFTYQTSSLPPNNTDKQVKNKVCKLNKLFLRAGRILVLGKKSQTQSFGWRLIIWRK